MTKWVVVGLLVLWSATAQAFNLRSGSWSYSYPSDWLIKPDGQSVTLTGGRGFKFTGYISDYWIDVNRCQAHAADGPCYPGTIHINWYTGTGMGHDHRGAGAIGTAVLNGVSYRVDGVNTRLQFYTYGFLRLPKLGKDGQRRTRTVVTPINGSFEHNGVFTPISGSVLVTAELEQEAGKWEVEEISYDLVTP